MRAYAVPERAATPRVVELPDPSPGPGEVLVRVVGSSVNGFDIAVASGGLEGLMEHRYPVVLGKDFAGTVEALGDGATGFASGDRVFGVVMKPYLGDGGLGELLVVGAQGSIAPAPDELDLTSAGALGLAGAAAVDSVDAVGLQPGQNVLVSGATGGVGSIAVQYAAATGATVIGTARPGPEADLVRDLGAAHAVDYSADLAAAVRAIAPDGVDAILHFAGGGPALIELLSGGGRIASTMGLGPDQHPAATAVRANPVRPTLERLAADVAAGRVRVPITRTYPLDESGRAFADFAAGAIGKLAIII